jgi:hypothetical protein
MAKIKLAGSKKTAKPSNLGAIPCGVLILFAIGLLSLLFYELLKSGI